jgi:Fe-S cluster assembly ATPase SufC
MNYFSPDSDFLEREINVGFSGGGRGEKVIRNNADTQFKS